MEHVVPVSRRQRIGLVVPLGVISSTTISVVGRVFFAEDLVVLDSAVRTA